MNKNKFGTAKEPLKLKSNAAKLVDDNVVDNLDESKNMGKKLAIKGQEKGQKLITLLENLGGVNKFNRSGLDVNSYYYIDNNRYIRANLEQYLDKDKFQLFTYDSFYEKYPFVIGDRVIVQGWKSPGIILRMHIKNFQVVYDIAFMEDKHTIATNVCVECIKPYYNETQTNKNEMAIFITGNINLKNQDKVEIKLGDDWEIKEENGKTYAVRKKTKITEDQLLDIGFSKCKKSNACDPDYVYTGPGEFYTLDMFLWIITGENFCSIRYNDFTVYPYETKHCVVYNIDTIKDIIDLQFSCLTKYKEVANKFKLKVSILELIKNKK